ncbi:hypothetical protein ACFL3P_02825 [Pseudomonadota bacterium]
MNKKLSYLLCFVAFLTTSVMANQAGDCDPVVKLGQQANTLQLALTALARQHDFELNFAVDADRSVESVEGMRLTKALKYLTSDVNTVLQHEKIEGCEVARLVSLEVLPVGEDTEYVYVKPATVTQQSKPRKEKNNKKNKRKKAREKSDLDIQAEAVSSDDMALYAEEVLLGQRHRDADMTPEQLAEFRKAKRKARMRLEAEGLLEPKNPKQKNKNRDRKKKGRKVQEE